MTRRRPRRRRETETGETVPGSRCESGFFETQKRNRTYCIAFRNSSGFGQTNNRSGADAPKRKKAGDCITNTEAERPAGMAELLMHRLRLLIEAAEEPDVKTLRDFVAVLKDLTALTRDLTPQGEDAMTGVILLPAVREEEA